jgi:hypothetical protein
MPSKIPPEVLKIFKKTGRKGGLISKSKGVDYRELQRKSTEKRLQNKAKKLSTEKP